MPLVRSLNLPRSLDLFQAGSGAAQDRRRRHLPLRQQAGGVHQRRASISAPITLGHEAVGTVHELGIGVTRVSVDDAVAVYGPRGCGICASIIRGEENYCPYAARLGLKLDLALQVGAHAVLRPGKGTVEQIQNAARGRGAEVVSDCVGSAATIETASDAVMVNGAIRIVGLGGGRLAMGFGSTSLGVKVSVPYWGSHHEFLEVLELARNGAIRVLLRNTHSRRPQPRTNGSQAVRSPVALW